MTNDNPCRVSEESGDPSWCVEHDAKWPGNQDQCNATAPLSNPDAYRDTPGGFIHSSNAWRAITRSGR